MPGRHSPPLAPAAEATGTLKRPARKTAKAKGEETLHNLTEAEQESLTLPEDNSGPANSPQDPGKSSTTLVDSQGDTLPSASVHSSAPDPSSHVSSAQDE